MKEEHQGCRKKRRKEEKSYVSAKATHVMSLSLTPSEASTAHLFIVVAIIDIIDIIVINNGS